MVIVTGTCTIVTDEFPLGLFRFQDMSLGAVVLLGKRYRLIPSLFYIWLWDTRLCLFLIMFRMNCLIHPLLEVLFQAIV